MHTEQLYPAVCFCQDVLGDGESIDVPLIDDNRISAMKFEAARIHFLSRRCLISLPI